MTPAAFDFRKPPPGDLGRHVTGWLAAAGRRATGAWHDLLAYPAEWAAGPVDAVPVAACLAEFSADTIGFAVESADPADEPFLLAARRPLLMALMAGLMSEAPDALPADRDLTELEASLLGYLLRELFLAPLERGWPLAAPLRLTAAAPGTPRAAWRGPGDDLVLRADLTVAAPFGRHPVALVLPRTGLAARLARPAARPAAAPDPGGRGQIEALVREMAVELDVVLGSADLSMPDLARLRAGDLIVLRQRVSDPLDGLVAGARKFRVWPGAVGPRTAVQILTPADG